MIYIYIYIYIYPKVLRPSVALRRGRAPRSSPRQVSGKYSDRGVGTATATGSLEKGTRRGQGVPRLRDFRASTLHTARF